MNFPVSKDTWTRKVDRDLSIGEIGDLIEKSWYGDWADWLEAFQDILGYNIIEGYSDLNERLDDLTTSSKSLVFSLLGG